MIELERLTQLDAFVNGGAVGHLIHINELIHPHIQNDQRLFFDLFDADGRILTDDILERKLALQYAVDERGEERSVSPFRFSSLIT